MNSNYSSKTLELILSNLKPLGYDIPITFYINSPKVINNINTDISFSLSVSGNTPITGSSETQEINLIVNGNTVEPLTIKSMAEITLPKLTLNGNTVEEEIPITTTANTPITLDVTGTANTLIPKLKVNSVLPSLDVELPISGLAEDKIKLNALGYLTIPELTTKGKTDESKVDVNVTGSSFSEINMDGTVTGILPQLNVIGSTNKVPLSIDLIAKARSNLSIENMELEDSALPYVAGTSISDDNPQKIYHRKNNSVYFKGKAKGSIEPLTINGVTESTSVSFPIMSQSSGSITLTSTGSVDIPKLNVNARTLPIDANVDLDIEENIKLPLSGVAKGTIPSSKLKGESVPVTITSNVSGNATGNTIIESSGVAVIPKLTLKGETSESTIPVVLTTTPTNPSTINGTAIGTLPASNISGTANTDGLPVTGSINVNPKIIYSTPAFTGYISKINSNIVTIKEIDSTNIITLDLSSIINISFNTNNSIITSNKTDSNNSSNPLEKTLIDAWSSNCFMELYGSNLSNQTNPYIHTDDIKYISKGVMWTEKSYDGIYENSIYQISNLIGFSLKSSE